MTSAPVLRSFVTLTDEAAEMFDYKREDGVQCSVKWARDPFIVQAVGESESGKVYVRLGRWLTATLDHPAARVPYSIIVGLEHIGATVESFMGEVVAT